MLASCEGCSFSAAEIRIDTPQDHLASQTPNHDPISRFQGVFNDAQSARCSRVRYSQSCFLFSLWQTARIVMRCSNAPIALDVVRPTEKSMQYSSFPQSHPSRIAFAGSASLPRNSIEIPPSPPRKEKNINDTKMKKSRGFTALAPI